MAVAQEAKESPRSEKGEEILKEDCSACHEPNVVRFHFLTRNEWTEKVKSMVDMGASVKPDDMPVLIDYLVKTYGYQLPDGPGKDLLEKTCNGACHDVQRIVQQKWSRPRWDNLLEEMIANGVDINDDDYEVLLTYLARNFKPAQ